MPTESRLSRIFASRRVLVAYLCVGDPSLDESLELARACVRAGADVLELGVPFSDPAADGPVIARAGARALARGGGLSATLRVASALRTESDVPLVLFGYYNPIYVRGEARAVDEAADAGIDAFLVVDLPLEEAGTLRRLAANRGLTVVPLLAPTSSPQRIEAVRLAHAEVPMDFVYYVSVTGITGAAGVQAADAGTKARTLREALGLPVVVGFGIDSQEKARAAGQQADGVVVGTALVRAIEEGQSAADRVERVSSLIALLRQGLDGT